MCPHVDVKFVRMPRDLSVESSVQRWVDRIGWANVEVESAEVTIERSGWRRTSVCLTLTLTGERPFTAATSHVDVYVAVADVFREVRKQVIRHVAASAGRSLALLG
jgi:ribosome-associated translation inhibitor RaiA